MLMTFVLPTLDYAYSALEPHIDARTMEIHHSKHHQWYTNKVNAALEWTDLASETNMSFILTHLDQLPEDKRQAVTNNGGWWLNHTIFWSIMWPNAGWTPTGKLAEMIDASFGSFNSFKEQFSTKAATLFGSGWARLCQDNEWNLVLKRTSFQNNPVMVGLHPLMGIDVWEHAYYLNYQNKRPDYIAAWFNVVDWDKVSERLQ